MSAGAQMDHSRKAEVEAGGIGLCSGAETDSVFRTSVHGMRSIIMYCHESTGVGSTESGQIGSR